jgi:hypothetical protein
MSADEATWRVLQRTCYGLAGANFLAVIQFVSAPQVATSDMVQLIASVPFLLGAGDTFDVLAKVKVPWSSTAGRLTVGMFTIGVVLGVGSLGRIFGGYREAFDYGLRISIILAFTFFFLISRMTGPKN